MERLMVMELHQFWTTELQEQALPIVTFLTTSMEMSPLRSFVVESAPSSAIYTLRRLMAPKVPEVTQLITPWIVSSEGLWVWGVRRCSKRPLEPKSPQRSGTTLVKKATLRVEST